MVARLAHNQEVVCSSQAPATLFVEISMPRSVNSVASRARRKRILRETKGYWGRRKNVWTVAKNAYEKALCYAYRDRRVKKRSYRSLWIQRINAACRLHNLSYSKFIKGLKANNIEINRKVLSHMASNDANAFSKIVSKCV